MKVAKVLRDIYEEARNEADKLKSFVDDLLRPICNSNEWHYMSRVKSDVSFALKIETGRFENPYELEDIFAATVVVPTSAHIKQVIKVVEENHFHVEEQRPASLEATTKLPESFQFDDLRIYVRYNQSPGLPPKVFLKRRFEIQLKTFLQHAWAVATHDLIYKGEKLDWTRSRIAYQIKAMLEHAEATITSVEELSKVFEDKQYKKFDDTNRLIDVYRRFWSSDLLPDDMKRLGETTYKLIEKLNIQVTQVIEALEEAEKQGLGGKLFSLSPYQSLIMALYVKDKQKFSKLKNMKIPITREMLDIFPSISALNSNAINFGEI